MFHNSSRFPRNDVILLSWFVWGGAQRNPRLRADTNGSRVAASRARTLDDCNAATRHGAYDFQSRGLRCVPPPATHMTSLTWQTSTGEWRPSIRAFALYEKSHAGLLTEKSHYDSVSLLVVGRFTLKGRRTGNPVQIRNGPRRCNRG